MAEGIIMLQRAQGIPKMATLPFPLDVHPNIKEVESLGTENQLFPLPAAASASQ